MCINNTAIRRNSTYKLIPSVTSFSQQNETLRDVHSDSPKVMPLIHHHHQHISDSKSKSLLPGFTAKNHIRHFVQHNYHDHVSDAPTSADTIENNKGGVVIPFPRLDLNM